MLIAIHNLARVKAEETKVLASYHMEVKLTALEEAAGRGGKQQVGRQMLPSSLLRHQHYRRKAADLGLSS